MRCKACDSKDARRYKGGDHYCSSCASSIRETLRELKFIRVVQEKGVQDDGDRCKDS